jgi:hypothetical protein
MESGINEARQLCKAIALEEDPERIKNLLDKLTEVLDERILVASLI